MFYAPHILQVKIQHDVEMDEFGRPVYGTGTDEWKYVCKCRCDDNSTEEFKSENGEVYRPDYHVLCEKNVTVEPGWEIRCLDGDSVRGSGIIHKVKNYNLLPYSEIWM